MIQRPISQIQLADLQALITDQVREGKSLDYKRNLPGPTDDDKRELLADASSFANAAGGDLVFGMDEAGGIPTAIVGIASANFDVEIQRINNILRTGLEPRLPVVETRAIEVAAGRWVLILRIQQSWIAPHRVTFRDHAKFYSRNSTGKYPLDVSELRLAFLRSEGVANQIRRFRDDRLAKVVSRETPVPLVQGASVVVHLVPLSSSASTTTIDLNDRNTLVRLRPPAVSGFNYRVNLDGYINYGGASSDRRSYSSYALCFRSGALEFCAIFEPEDRWSLPSVAVERYFMESVASGLDFYRRIGIEPPIYLFMALMGVRSYKWAVDPSRFFRLEVMPLDRDDIVLPEQVIDDLNTPVHTVMRPLFDLIWQAYGFDRSYSYNAAGQWEGR